MHEETMEARGAVSGGAAVSAGPARVPVPPDLDFELLASDGEPLETYWHHLEISLMGNVVRTTMWARGRREFFIGGNMFVYYDPQQARGIATDPGTREHYKGPDIFFVSGVEPGIRDYWVTWEEGRYPEVIVELISMSTEKKDRGTNKDLYEQTFRTPEYFLYDPKKEKLEGFRLRGGPAGRGRYREIPATAEGRLWSEQLQAYLGLWRGTYEGETDTWVRLFDRQGRLLPTSDESKEERAEQAEQREEEERKQKLEERQRAQLAEQRAAEAEAKIAALEARFAASGS
jgi:Uma2 family endonuclease